MWDELREDLAFERGRLTETVRVLKTALGTGREFDPLLTAFAAVTVHSFYNGVENCLKLIARSRGAVSKGQPNM